MQGISHAGKAVGGRDTLAPLLIAKNLFILVAGRDSGQKEERRKVN